MGKRMLTEAELRARRENGKLGGRPPKPVSARAIREEAKARAGVRRARRMAKTVAEEAMGVLVEAMRGTLPGSDARSMAAAADAVVRKAGIGDLQITKDVTPGGKRAVFHFDISTSAYPPAHGVEKEPDAPGTQDGSALEH